MSTIFTKIINREIPSYIIAEDENFVAFLDAMPLVKGHTLVVPKKETDLIFDLESDEYKNLWGFTQEIAKKIKNAVPCVRVGVAVVGLEVPHAHIHLIPLNTVEDMNFKNARLKLTDEEYKEIQKSIINS
ncbi:HIT family protein [Chryseobacterium camelliae]|uniref:HIT family protein n=1 Tax=Chryseobacterium camelliae TaxID=1265445 RepID=UPI00286217CE|nr:HIT family protein [Chryseobacterium camelliae]MDR6517175.1 histidine triad (HIT) family protein [Chryseobacterium camelliae]